MGGILGQLLLFAPIIVVFYFLMIRPQMKRQKETKKMIDDLQLLEEETA